MTRIINWTKEMLFYRSLVEGAKVIGWITVDDGYCAYLSPRWHEVTGTSADQGHGTEWLDCLHPDDRIRVRQLFFSTSDTGREYGVDYRLRTADGTYVLMWGHGLPWRGANGGFLGYLGTSTPMHDYSGKARHLTALEHAPLAQPLTPREREVARLIADGNTTETIGEMLDISARTVETHIKSVMEKLDANNRTHAIAKALMLNVL